LNAGQLGGAESPVEIGVGYNRHSACSPEGIHVVLKAVGDVLSAGALDSGICDPQSNKVNRLVLTAVGDFVSGDQDEVVGNERSELIDWCNEVVVGKRQEIVAMVPVPADDIGRKRVPVGIACVGVEVSFVPGSRSLQDASRIEGEGGENNEKGKEDEAGRLSMIRPLYATKKDETNEPHFS
jgi:hypothetical protein